jgi:hypothetical protein
MNSEKNQWAVGMLTFTRETSGVGQGGGGGEVQLIPGGGDVAVTDANKARYVAALVRHRATRVAGTSTLAAIDAMRRGLNDVVPLSLLRGFTPQELCRAVCGMPDLCPRYGRGGRWLQSLLVGHACRRLSHGFEVQGFNSRSEPGVPDSCSRYHRGVGSGFRIQWTECAIKQIMVTLYRRMFC